MLVDEAPYKAGEVVTLLAEFGNQWCFFGLCTPCDSKGDAIDPSKQILIPVGQESTGEVVIIGKEKEAVAVIPDGSIDLNSQSSSESQLKKEGRIVAGRGN
jgi:hypothetical protein